MEVTYLWAPLAERELSPQVDDGRIEIDVTTDNPLRESSDKAQNGASSE
jgi:hypothetical protein